MPEVAVRPSYRFALRPRWLLLHAAAVAALALMVAACSWQLSRLEQKQERNRLYDERSALPVEDVAVVVPPGATQDQVAQARYRSLSATGRFAVHEEVFVRSRSLDGHPGAWVLTPLVLDGGGTAVVVNRGWIPATDTSPVLPTGAEAPTGTVSVTGVAMAGESRGALGSVDREGTQLQVLARADLARLQEQIDERLLPVYLQLQAQAPAPTEPYPVLIPRPAHDEGPHRGYAGQWAIFALIWVVGYPMLIRRSAIGRVQQRADEDAGSAAPSRPVDADVLAGQRER